MFEHHTVPTLRFIQGKTAFCSVKSTYFNKLNEFLSAQSVEYLNGIIGKFRSFSELEAESEGKNFRSWSWNRNREKKILGVGVGIGLAEVKFSESESGFGAKKLDSAGP